MQIRQALVDIQYGRAEDTFGWMHQVCLTASVERAAGIGRPGPRADQLDA